MSRKQVDLITSATAIGAGALAACLAGPSDGVGILTGAVVGALSGWGTDSVINLTQLALPEEDREWAHGGFGIGLITGAVTGMFGGNPCAATTTLVATDAIVKRTLNQLSGQKTTREMLDEGHYMYANGRLIFLHPDLPQPE